jgi:hypothetical protein
MLRGWSCWVIEAASACAMWASLAAPVLADAGEKPVTNADAFGYGGAYLFGFLGGLALFGLRLAINLRKAHLKEFAK